MKEKVLFLCEKCGKEFEIHIDCENHELSNIACDFFCNLFIEKIIENKDVILKDNNKLCRPNSAVWFEESYLMDNNLNLEELTAEMLYRFLLKNAPKKSSNKKTPRSRHILESAVTRVL